MDYPHPGGLGCFRLKKDVMPVDMSKDRAFLAAIVETADDAIVSKSLDGFITSWNKAAEQMFGYAAEEVIGRPMTIIFPPDRINEESVFLAKIARKELVRHYETVRVRKDGSMIDVSVSLSPILDGDGGVLGVAKIVRDITRVKQALEERFRLGEALRQIGQPLVMMDLDKRIFYANAEFLELMGYSADQVMGQSFFDFVPEDDASRRVHADVTARILEQGRWSQEIERIARDGRRIPLYASVSLLRDSQGAPQGYIASYVDLQPLKEKASALEASETRYRSVLDHAADAVFISAPEGHFRYGNRQACRLLGYSRDELLTMTIPDLTPAQDRVEVKRLITEMKSVGHLTTELRFIRKDGTILPIELNAVMLPDGDAYESCRDISERKRTAELEAADRAKSAFLANMSHEIRTPLNAILGFAQVGLRDSGGRKSHGHFARILESGQSLLEVINDILDISKLQAGRMSLEFLPMVLSEVLDRSLHMVALRADAKCISMTVRESSNLPAVCLGDPGRLQQVLVNLLTNAVKFTPAGGSVALTVARERGVLTFTVTDTGIGIAPEAVDRLFDPFEQADNSTTRRFGGTGLGLSISRQLVEMMGGTISVKSAPGCGSGFTVCLPLTGEVEAEPMDALEIVAVGLHDTEVEILAECFGGCLVAADLGHLPDRSVLVVVDSVFLYDGSAQIESALDRGVNLAVVLNPSHPPLEPRIADNLRVLERPLRCRHVRQFGAMQTSALNLKRPQKRLAGLVVVAAEDNEVNRLVLDDMLRGEGAEVILCENGNRALSQVRHRNGQEIDVLLTDIQMPEMDGYALASAVTALAPDLPVIGLTAHATAEDRKTCLAAGMVEHVAKPIDLDALVAVILRHVRRSVRSPAFNKAALATHFGDRRDFILRLVETMILAHGGTASRLRETAASADLHGLASLAHSVKGSAGNLQADKVQTLATATERAARAGLADAIPKALLLAEAVDELLAELKQWDGGNA